MPEDYDFSTASKFYITQTRTGKIMIRTSNSEQTPSGKKHSSKIGSDSPAKYFGLNLVFLLQSRSQQIWVHRARITLYPDLRTLGLWRWRRHGLGWLLKNRSHHRLPNRTRTKTKSRKHFQFVLLDARLLHDVCHEIRKMVAMWSGSLSRQALQVWQKPWHRSQVQKGPALSLLQIVLRNQLCLCR